MSKKIIMLGGRRAGKSSILASVLKCLNNDLGKIGATVKDISDISGLKANDTLNGKTVELEMYFDQQGKTNRQFVVDTNPSMGSSTYTLKIGKIEGGKLVSVDFDFVDVPGEWMTRFNDGAAINKDGITNYDWLISQVKEGDVFIVAIDTPYLFAKPAVNRVYNKIQEITDILKEISSNNELDTKMVIFCPVKAEKYFEDGSIGDVSQKVTQLYADFINLWTDTSGKLDQRMKILVMPVKTAGGLDFVKLRIPVKYYANDSQQVSTLSGIDSDANINNESLKIYSEDGRIMRRTKDCTIEFPREGDLDFNNWMFGKYIIPKAWYQCNGRGYSPEYCEQPAFRILQFLLAKDISVEKKKEEIIPKIQFSPWPWNILRSLGQMLYISYVFIKKYNSTFDIEKRHVFQSLLKEIENNWLLKEYAGYLEVKTKVEINHNDQ